MPVVFREGALRFFFYSNEGKPREPAHVHVQAGDKDAKVWLEPDVAIADSYGFNSAELARIVRLVSVRRDFILRAWNDHFGDGS